MIKYFYYCTECETVVENPCNDGNTNRLLRHVCNDNLFENDDDNLKIKSKDKENLKLAAANFIAKDLRPFYAIQCAGLLDLCFACMQFGQHYRKATKEHLERAMPSRNTVKDAVCNMAKTAKESIAQSIRRAIFDGGIGATTDTWTDDYIHTTYICVVAHICLVENGSIKYKRYVLNTSEIDEIVKTGKIEY